MPNKSIGAAAISILLVAGCGNKPTKPEFGNFGFDATGMDKSVKPGDSFCRYANGGWLDRTAIPSDRTSVWADTPADDLTEARLHEILERGAATAGHEPTTLEGKAGAFYKSFIDETRCDQLGAKPIKPELDEVRAAHAADELAGLTGRSVRDFDGSFFKLWQNIDLRDPKHYAVYLGQDGLGLPGLDYYSKPAFSQTKASYEAYVGRLLQLIDWRDAEANAKRVVELETAAAAVSWTEEQQRDAVLNYNAMSVTELEKMAPGFEWRTFLAQAGLPQVTRVVVAEKGAFPKLAAIWKRTPPDVLQAWAAFHIADNAAPYLSKDFANAYFEFRGKTLGGQVEQKMRWKRGVFAVAGGDFLNVGRFGSFGTMGFGTGQLYTSKYFGTDAKAKIESLVANLRAAFRGRIERLEWMEPSTKVEALRKLDAYLVKVGYPDHPRDYSALRIVDDDLAGNVRRAAELDWGYYTMRLGGPVDRSDWGWTPQTNNSYNGDLIDITFPAGILHAPNFDPAADPALNYGAIGGLIGHELTHGFDDQGRKVEASGELKEWWQKSDAAEFDARAKKLGAQYATYEALPGLYLKPELTMGENIADLGGLTIALDAYHASLGGKPAAVVDGWTGDQRVFLGWAQSWREKRTEAALRKQVASNPHSPSRFRVDGVVRNIDAWYEAFGVKPGDKLYLPPEERVRIW